ncbi:MAG: ATP-binding cassette domain-containing protein [Pseudoflavonifractor sp.]
MPMILDKVSFAYEAGTAYEVQALDEVSLTIGDGEFVGIMGGTGCGKSTLIRLMAGLMVPSAGRVLLDGADVNAKGYPRALLRKSLGILFQNPEYQLFETSVERDVAFGLKESGLSREETALRVRQALEQVGFDYGQIREQSPLALSGGEKRRVAIAGVLVSRPKILIFDEPIAGLDPMGRRAFLDLVRELNGAGTTIIIVSHNADCLSEYAGRILVLQGGQLALDGPPELVFSDLTRTKQLSICAGQARLIADLLARRGMPIPSGTTRYSALLAAVKQALNGGACP